MCILWHMIVIINVAIFDDVYAVLKYWFKNRLVETWGVIAELREEHGGDIKLFFYHQYSGTNQNP